ncbi:MAG: rod shape-determining protein MreC [Pseudomonadota bacterium]
MDFFRRYRDFFICVILLGLPFLFLHSNLKDPSRHNSYDKVILKLSTPIQYISSMVARTISDVWGSYIYLVDVREENEFLKMENLRLRKVNEKTNQIHMENLRLRKMLDFKDSAKHKLLAAQVIGKNTSPYFRVMRIVIDRGGMTVAPGMAVVTNEGLVGQIDEAWDEYSDVLLTVDPKSSIDVYIERNKSRGLLKGTGDSSRYECKIEYLLKTDEVQVGDAVVTSGMGKLFPEGIEVGKVSKIRKRDFGLFQEAWVQPSVDLSRVKDVFVMVMQE